MNHYLSPTSRITSAALKERDRSQFYCDFQSERDSHEGDMKYVVEVEPARPAKNGRPVMGPAYRSIYAKEGFAELPPGINTCWDVFRSAVDTYPDNPMLGHRENIDGKAGGYVWLSYREVYDKVVKLGSAIRSCGVEKGGRCGIYGANSPQWIISLEACNAHGILCVPLYDTLGAGAIEFIIRHAEVSITFVETKKIPELLIALPNIKEYLKTLVSFGKVTPEQKEEVSNHGLTIYAWDEFLEMEVVREYKLPERKKSDICTIMYTSGTTGDPKGVLIPNGSLVAAIAGLRHHMIAGNIALHSEDVYLSYLPLAHIFDRAMVECNIYHGARIGFWRGDIKFLLEDIAELRPTEFCAVPRVLDRIYSGLQQKLAAGGSDDFTGKGSDGPQEKDSTEHIHLAKVP
ncbi:Long chain acyl-CoA synthetase 4-like protein [Drosera capensis]